MFLSFPVYLLMQIVALSEMKGWWRIVAFLPVIPMIYIIVGTIIGYSEGANLWPIMLLLTSPAAFLYMCVFFILFGIVKVINNKRSNKSSMDASVNRQ